MKEKYFVRTISIFAAVIIIILVLIGSLFIFSFDKRFYTNQFEKNDIYQELDINKTEADQEFFKVVDYVSGKEESINSSYFNSKEKAHLKDVRDIFETLKVIFFILQTILVILVVKTIYAKRSEKIRIDKNYMVKSMNVIFGLLVAFLIYAYLNFTKAFYIMHEIMFTNDLYLLNPATDNLIVYLPETIFYTIFIKIFIVFLVFMTAVNIYNNTKHKKKISYTSKNG